MQLTPTFEPNNKLGIKKSNLSRDFAPRFRLVYEWTKKVVQKLVLTPGYDFKTRLKLHFWMSKVEFLFAWYTLCNIPSKNFFQQIK